MTSRRQGIMLAHPFDERRLTNSIRRQRPWNPPFLLQPKLDGERCRALIGPRVVLFSSEQHVIKSVPHINEALAALNLPHGLELDGELYQHGTDFSEIHSKVGRSATLHLDYESMDYHIFDLVDPNMPQLDPLQYLPPIPFKPPLELVKTHVISSLAEVYEWMTSFVDFGYEGIILREANNLYVRRRSTQMMKFKPKKSDYYPVIGFTEEISITGEPKNSLGALVCTSDEGTTFNVGSGFTADQRHELWKRRHELVGCVCHVKYQNITSNHVPRFPVFCELLDPTDAGPELKLFEGGDTFA